MDFKRHQIVGTGIRKTDELLLGVSGGIVSKTMTSFEKERKPYMAMQRCGRKINLSERGRRVVRL